MPVTETKVEPMPRPKRPSEENPPTTPIKVERSLAKKAKAIADDRGIDLSAYVSEALRPVISKDWARMIKKIDSEESKGS